MDDFLKVFRKINEGLNQNKIGLQLAGGIIFYIFSERHGAGSLLNVLIRTLLGHFTFSLLYFGWLVPNAVNLTDGIDGLASISVAISLSAYSIAYMQGK
ncbi:MAG: hypothetical protein ACLUAO_00455 [Streptococcus sp.]